MPRFRPTAKLERSALADLCKQTLSRIPTWSGKLVYLASLRDVHSGTYKHYGLISVFGRDEAVKALRESHQAAFRSWLALSLAEKNDDLRQYISSLILRRKPWTMGCDRPCIAPMCRRRLSQPRPICFARIWRPCSSSSAMRPSAAGPVPVPVRWIEAHRDLRNLPDHLNLVRITVSFWFIKRCRMRLNDKLAVPQRAPAAYVTIAML